MKRFVALALMISLMLLGGCSSQSAWEKKFEDRREALNAAQQISFTVEATSNLATSQFTCKMDCVADDTGVTVKVLEPEIIAGVTAHIGEDSEISYEGIQLHVGDLTATGITPVTATATVIRALCLGFTQQLWVEKYEGQELLVAQLYEDEEVDIKIWLTTDELTPIHAEIVSDGEAVFSCDITQFLLN